MGTTGPAGCGDLAAAIDSWRVATGRHGRVSTADLRAGVEDGRIAPKTRVYESDWAQMMRTTDVAERLRMATAIKDRLTGLYRYYEQRLSRVNEVLDAIDAQRPMRLDLDSLALGEVDRGSRGRARKRERKKKYGRCPYISALLILKSY